MKIKVPYPHIKRIFLSVSGGRTSMMMGIILKPILESLGYEVVLLFANTGQEHEETLIFVNKCDKHFNLGIVWLEARVIFQEGTGTDFTKVTFESATRGGGDNGGRR